jgi:hypothetical protein
MVAARFVWFGDNVKGVETPAPPPPPPWQNLFGRVQRVDARPVPVAGGLVVACLPNRFVQQPQPQKEQFH